MSKDNSAEDKSRLAAKKGGHGGALLAGAAIGSIIPGIGTIIGGLAGGLLGGGLGSLTGSSNQGAIANFNQGGLGSYLFKQGGGNNGQLSTQAANSVSATIKSLQTQWAAAARPAAAAEPAPSTPVSPPDAVSAP